MEVLGVMLAVYKVFPEDTAVVEFREGGPRRESDSVSRAIADFGDAGDVSGVRGVERNSSKSSAVSMIGKSFSATTSERSSGSA